MTEHQLQASFFDWVSHKSNSDKRYLNIYAQQNAQYILSRLPKNYIFSILAFLKKEGVKKGIPDVCVAYPRMPHHAFYLEFKVGKGKQSDAQKEWQKKLESAGYKYLLCYDLETAIKEVESYFS